MDHTQLLDKIEDRLDKTDQKIDSLRDELNRYSLKVAVLEAQMAGVTKVGVISLAALVSIIVWGLKKGFFQ